MVPDALPVASSEGHFSRVPDDLIRLILSYSDVCSLGRVAQVSHCFLSTSASDDVTWAAIVENRFHLDTSKSRTKTHGGSTWKEVYHNLSKCNRIPKSRYTAARKIIFAKGGGVTRKSNSAVAVWVLLSHTEDCLTRRSEFTSHDGEDYRCFANTRFIEFNVCVQNVKSGQGIVHVNIIESTLELLGNSDLSRPLPFGLMRPRILYRSRNAERLAEPNGSVDTINLHPFEFCVVSMNFPCQNDVYETDVLSRAVRLSVHFSVAGCCNTNVANAKFIDDSEIWNHYVELPGSCLTLNDRSLLIAA